MRSLSFLVALGLLGMCGTGGAMISHVNLYTSGGVGFCRFAHIRNGFFLDLSKDDSPLVEKDSSYLSIPSGNMLIKFPRDGKQPEDRMLPDLALTECADDRVSESYLKIAKEYRLGYCGKNRVPIINFRDSIDFEKNLASIVKYVDYDREKDLRALGSEKSIKWLNETLEFFCTTSTGRELLYRMVIETNRVLRCNHNGITEDRFKNVYERNKNRCVVMCEGDDSFYYVTDEERDVRFNAARIELAEDPICVSCIQKRGEEHVVLPVETELLKRRSAMMFHELLHLYLFLRNPFRTAVESFAFLSKKGSDNWGKKGKRLGCSFHFRGLDGVDDKRRERVCARLWCYGRPNDKGIMVYEQIDFHEMRTIWGVPTAELFCSNVDVQDVSYSNGDRLNENRFRKEIKLPLRGGHVENLGIRSSLPLVMRLDPAVVKRVQETAGDEGDIVNSGPIIERDGVERGLGSSGILFNRKDKSAVQNAIKSSLN